MLNGLKIVGFAVLVAVAGLSLYASTRPDHFRVARSRTIDATADVLFPLIVDLRRFNEWNPFATGDASIRIAYGAASADPGASYSWDSSGRAGKGRLRITEADRPRRVAMALDFERPMQAHNEVVFTLQQQGAATAVTWEMTGAASFLQKAMGVLFNMDRMVGDEFDKGLAALAANAHRRQREPVGPAPMPPADGFARPRSGSQGSP